jgi:Tol biopolymer transport system component
MTLPEGYDFSMWFDRFVPSPNGHYLAGISKTETGENISILDTLTLNPILPGDGWLNWIGSNGKHQSASGYFYGWHPNGYEFLFQERNAPDRGLWLVDARTGQHRLIAQLPTLDISGAAISPDGQRLAYATNTFDVHQIWIANPDGSEPHLLLESNTMAYVFSWSPDGRYLLYTGEPTPAVGKGTPIPNTGGPLWVMDRDGKSRKALHVPFILGFGFTPTWSPAGHTVAGVGGTDEAAPCWQKGDAFQADPLCWFKGTGVYVENIDTGDLQLTARNAIDPVWSPDGSRLAASRMDTKQQVDIWLVDAPGRTPRRLTDTPEVDRYPIWLQP